MSNNRKSATKVNTPGVRENGDGSVTVQMAKRSAQLEGIGDAIKKHISGEAPLTHHRLNGYAEQLGIIADELAAEGK